MNAALLALSVLLSTGRNLFSKSLSSILFGTRTFFLCQSVLFACGACTVALIGGLSLAINAEAIFFSFSYGILLLIAQWLYTAALSKESTAMCATVYSMGFILPTLSGAIFWAEPLDLLDLPGILCAILAVGISGINRQSVTPHKKSIPSVSLTLAMLASGGLGILQKFQQSSAGAAQRGTFLFLAFLLASLLSLSAALICEKRSKKTPHRKKFFSAALVGSFFGICNFLNTYLAGRMESAIFFPTLNIGIILLSMVCGMIFYREHLKSKDLAVLILGAFAILFLNL